MNHSIINLLEAIKIEPEVDYCNYISEKEISIIRDWYNRFSTQKEEVNNIVDLMYFLYIHEDIDCYTVDHYQDTVNQLSDKYVLDKTRFLDMFQEFRTIIFANDIEREEVV